MFSIANQGLSVTIILGLCRFHGLDELIASLVDSLFTCTSVPRAYIYNMMGKSHAAMGLAVGAGIGVAVFGLSSPTWLIPTVAVCGAAILPDIDEPGSTVSREFGLVSEAFSFVVNKIAGGHRKLTHSLLGVGIVLVLLWLFSTNKEGSAILFGLLAASAWRIVIPWWLRLRRLFILAGVGGGLMFYHANLISGLWLVALVGVGWLVHMAGDYLTRGGIPLLYPKKEGFSLSVFGTTGSKLETLFAAVLYLSVFVTLGLWFSHYSHGAQFTNFVSARFGKVAYEK